MRRDSDARICDTFDCPRKAEYKVRWRSLTESDRTIEGDYCEDCAEKLGRAGDEVQPPLPGAEVIPLRRS